MTLKILDCTLRDGGYYNDWRYPRPLVAAYLHAMAAAKVDVVEIGFRNFAKNRFLGPYAFSTDDFLGTLPLPAGVELAVMADAKELIGRAGSVDALFRPKADSPVSLVRIAAHFAEVPKCAGIVARLKALGYRVGFNLMQAGGRSAAEIAAAARQVSGWDAVDVLYFADSLGNMEAQAIKDTVAALKGGWSGPVGVHAHDNMGHALTNNLAALDAGATWLDATILGMGRGAGNTRTEHLLLELVRRGLGDYRPEALFPLVLGDFERLRAQYRWGAGLLYYLSAAYGIHPTYVQVMLSDDRYRKEDIVAGLAYLRDSGGASFSQARLETALRPAEERLAGSWTATGWAKGRTVLIVAPGPGAHEHAEALAAFVARHKPLVLALNAKAALPAAMIDAYCTCDPARLAVEAGMYRDLKRPVAVPVSALTPAARARMDGVTLLDYGLIVASNRFAADATECTVPRRLAAAYALALANAAGASRILLAGFDGFDPAEPRHLAMAEVFELYGRAPNLAPLVAVTPTNFAVHQSSIYAPDV